MNQAQGMASARSGRLLQAAEWLTRLREGELSSDDLRRWLQFILLPDHRDDFDTVQHVANVARQIAHPSLPEASELSADTYDGSVSVRDWMAARGMTQTHPEKPRRWWFLSKAAWAASAAASIAGGFIVLGLWLAQDWMRSTHAPEETIQTETGQYRTVLLKDGSTLTLGAKTAVRVTLGADRRLLYLDRGEALFTVAHDSKRPFIVQAGPRTVTAVGTEFKIWHALDRTIVTVTEGVVDVKPIAAVALTADSVKPSSHARVHKGEKLTYQESGDATTLETADLASEMTWREGRHVYRHVALKYVIADANRYFKQQFVINDRAVAELPFSGSVLGTHSAGEFLRALESIFPVEAVQTDTGEIIIRARASEARHSPDRKIASKGGSAEAQR